MLARINSYRKKNIRIRLPLQYGHLNASGGPVKYITNLGILHENILRNFLYTDIIMNVIQQHRRKR